FRGRVAGRGPVIDQEGRDIPDANLRTQFEGMRFDFGHSAANPFGDLTREQRLARLDAIAKLLDVAFIVPGTNFRYGIDGLIGLIPVIGDIITTAISLWVVREARALGAPWHVTARMLANVAVDGLVLGADGRARPARQREGFAFIERADAALVEAGFLDLQVGTVQRVRRQLLDREANRFRRGAKTPIGKPGPLLLADRGRKQFGG